MVGMRAATLAPFELHDEVEAHFRTVPHAGAAELRSVCQRKNGTPFHAELRSTSFEYHGVQHVLSMIRDITARVEAEEAVQEERQRLSRELHDSVSQALFGIGIGAKTARAVIERDPAKAIECIEYIHSLAKTGMADMRALLFDLRPESLETEGLVTGLQKQAEALTARHEIPVEMALCQEPQAPLPVKEALYRIAQEAMHNTFKHAQATQVHLSLSGSDGESILEIRDNGIGFDPGGSFPGHVGLHSMEERATHLGGRLEVESAVGHGTRIRVRIPTPPV
jgi:signal transduction histidine kinase